MNSDNFVKEKDKRKCRFYVRYIEGQNWSGLIKFNWKDDKNNQEKMLYWINNGLSHHFSPVPKEDKEDIHNFIKFMESQYSSFILPIETFNWLKDEERACFYYWYKHINHRWKIPTILTSQEMLECIIDDSDADFRYRHGEKKNKINEAKAIFHTIRITGNPVKSEEHDSEDINYLWSYFIKPPAEILRFFPNTDEIEKKKMLITGYYDCILNNDAERENCLLKLKSPFSSHKNRKKNRTKGINKNFVLPFDICDELNKISLDKGINQRELIIKLIHDAYNIHKNS